MAKSSEVNDERSEPKVVLLVRLLSRIDEGRFTFEQLKEQIADGKPPSTRSLRRYLSVLAEAGFPWYFDRTSGTYRFTDGYSLRRLNLSQRELLGLVTLKRLGASLGGTLASYIEETTAKLLQSSDRRSSSAMNASSLAIRLESVALEPAVEALFETLQSAERDHRRVQFTYTDKVGTESQRRVNPYGFIVSNGRIYLVGFDVGRNGMRVFAIDNIAALTVLPQTFQKPVDFNLDAYGANSVSGVRHGASLTEVSVRFSPIVAKAAIAANVARERRIDRRDDGSVDIVYRVADSLEIVRWSLSWGTEAEILAPPEARMQAAEIVTNLARTYKT